VIGAHLFRDEFIRNGLIRLSVQKIAFSKLLSAVRDRSNVAKIRDIRQGQ
jgi:hypothetical protein